MSLPSKVISIFADAIIRDKWVEDIKEKKTTLDFQDYANMMVHDPRIVNAAILRYLDHHYMHDLKWKDGEDIPTAREN